MATVELDSIVNAYLANLSVALGDLPASQRQQIVESIATHIDEARATVNSESEATLREMLDRLGEPSEIAAAALADVAVRRPRRSRTIRRRILSSAFAFAVAAFVVLGFFLSGTFNSPPVRYGTVPRIISLNIGAAERAITSAGFKPWLYCTNKGSPVPSRVEAQTPGPNQKFPLGDYVTFFARQSSPPGCHSTEPPLGQSR